MCDKCASDGYLALAQDLAQMSQRGGILGPWASKVLHTLAERDNVIRGMLKVMSAEKLDTPEIATIQAGEVGELAPNETATLLGAVPGEEDDKIPTPPAPHLKLVH